MSEDRIQAKPRSDLGIRTASGVVMMVLAIGALWAGGWVFGAFVTAVGLGVYFEWVRLVRSFAPNQPRQSIWLIGGLIYIGVACFSLESLGGVFGNNLGFGIFPAVALIMGVVGTDIGAYFAGRTFGGPKIAPKISPSKTWSGLIGGTIGASLMLHVASSNGFLLIPEPQVYNYHAPSLQAICALGVALAVAAQAGDFFESWMKRRAGVKDSGALIPGHGGLFDRADGLLAVSVGAGILMFAGVL